MVPNFDWVQLGSFGVVVWLLVYDHKILIPKIVKDFRDDMDKSRSLFQITIEHERQTFEKEISQQRETFLSLIREVMNAAPKTAEKQK